MGFGAEKTLGVAHALNTSVCGQGESEVEEDIVVRLCDGLECKREEIVVGEDGANA